MNKSILVISPNYPPETNAAAERIGFFAKYLAKHGWEVTVITLLPHHPQNQIYQDYTHVRTPYVRSEEGIKVVRFRPWIVSRTNFVKRLLSEAAFALRVLPEIRKTHAAVIMASSPYMFLGPLSLIASRLLNRKFVWDVRDLTWEYPKAAGINTYGLDYILKKVMLWTATHTDALVVVTEGLMSYFENHKPNLTAVVPNGVRDDWMDKLLQLERISSQARSHDQPLKVMYAGLLGYNHKVSTIVETAKYLPDVKFIIVGDGPERHNIIQLINKYQLENIKVLNFVNHDKLLHLYKNADILFAQVRDHPVHQWSESVKVWEYMCTGKPLIYAGKGVLADLIRREGLGMVISPEQSTELVKAIRVMKNNVDRGMEMAQRARSYVVKNRRRSELTARLEDLLLSLVGTCDSAASELDQ